MLYWKQVGKRFLIHGKNPLESFTNVEKTDNYVGKRYHEIMFLTKTERIRKKVDVTIKDIAADAGVSVSTVSRVVNGSKSVSPELKGRVMASIEKFHFRPNAAARSLVTRNTGLVAVLEADVRNPITALHLKQISDVCMKHDKVMIVCDYDFDQDKALLLMDNMLERNIDGLIFQGVHLNEEILERLRRFQCPVVLGNQGPSEDMRCEFPAVTVDSYHAAKDMTRFLISEGHKHIAYVGGSSEDYTNGTLRLRGFLDGMREADLQVQDSDIYQGEFSTESGEKGMNQIYENSLELPTAVVTGSDIIAAGVIRCLKAHKLKVPDDISVAGFDDSISDIYDPPLTTVRMLDQGEVFYNALFEEKGEACVNEWRYFPYQIVRRSSTRRITN